MSERKYFRVNPDSPAMGVIREAEERQRTFAAAMAALKKEYHGADVWVENNRWFAGVDFKGELPRGWRRSKDYAVPDKRIKAGRELAKRFDALPSGVDARVFSSMMSHALDGDYCHFGEGRIRWTVFEKYGETYILSVPVQCPTPSGCDELKTSEYWQIRESGGTR